MDVERLATTILDHKWTEYENEATYHHARTFVEAKYRLRNTTENLSLVFDVVFSFFQKFLCYRTLTEPKNDLNLQAQMTTLNEKFTLIQEQIKLVRLNNNLFFFLFPILVFCFIE